LELGSPILEAVLGMEVPQRGPGAELLVRGAKPPKAEETLQIVHVVKVFVRHK